MLTRKRATPGAKTTATAKAARKGTGEEIPATAKTAPKDPVENTARKELGEKTLVTPKQQSSEKTSAAARKETGAKTPVNEKTTPKQQSSEKTSAAARKDSGETTPANAKTVSKTTPASVTSAPLATVTNNHLTTSELMKKLNLEQTNAVAKKSPTAARKTTPVIAKTVPKKESEEKASAAARKDTGEKATDKKLLTWPSETTRDDEVAASKKNIFSYLAPGSSRAAKAKKDATDTPKNPGKKVGEKAAGKELLISPSKATGTGGASGRPRRKHWKNTNVSVRRRTRLSISPRPLPTTKSLKTRSPMKKTKNLLHPKNRHLVIPTILMIPRTMITTGS
jgi:hypothetical protein